MDAPRPSSYRRAGPQGDAGHRGLDGRQGLLRKRHLRRRHGFRSFGGAALIATAGLPEIVRILWIVGAAFIQLRLLANLFDGMVAIARGTASKVGELFNEVPDRVSDSAILIGLGYAPGGQVGLGYAAALAAMMTAYVRAVGKGAGTPNEFCGPMAKQQRMFLATMTCLFCASRRLPGSGSTRAAASWASRASCWRSSSSGR